MQLAITSGSISLIDKNCIFVECILVNEFNFNDQTETHSKHIVHIYVPSPVFTSLLDRCYVIINHTVMTSLEWKCYSCSYDYDELKIGMIISNY